MRDGSPKADIMTDKHNASLRNATAAFEAGALDEAETNVRAVIDTAPERAEAWDLLAAILTRKGQAAEAIAVLQRAPELLPDAIALHNSLALALRRAGRVAEAQDQLRYALGLDPRQPELAAHLGDLLADTGRFDDAQDALRTAISLAPDNPKYSLLLGRISLAAGRSYEAKVAFAEAVKLGRARLTGADKNRPADPAFREAYYDALTHLAGLNFDEGKPAMALALLQEAIFFGGGESIRLQFANCLCATTFNEPHPELKTMLARALKEAWIMSADLVRAITPLLLLEPAFGALLRKVGGAEAGRILADKDARIVASDPLLRAILNEGLVTDPALERLLTALRAALLQARTGAAASRPEALVDYRDFAMALANQCFTNEYAFAETTGERDAVAGLQARLEQAVAENQAVADLDLALLASYRSLGRLSWADRILARTWQESLEPVIARQLREPARERELAAAIPSLTAIDDPTSQLVRRQYEENPFPRWVRTPVTSRHFTLDIWLRMHFPNLPPAEHSTAGPLEILVAGCGTGQEAIGSAQRFVASNVLAVDLSLGSLAYAARKTAELGLSNIAYAQADILALGKLERRFDIIECAGVLHHLADPLAGWRVLSELCKPGGYMLMALYSEQGRKDLRPVAELVAAGGYGTSADELRRFRADVLALDETSKAGSIVSTRDDFYSLSMLRDLAFHVQEHRFTIGKIDHALRELGLEFCGFGLTPNIRDRFQARFGAADLASLPLWDTFESENPGTFAAMYHLVVRKPL